MKDRSLDEYALFGVVDIGKARDLHALTQDARKLILNDSLWQDYLLNHGYMIDDEKRPSSFYEIVDHVWNRTRTMIHLGYVSQMIDLMTKPGLVSVERKKILLPGEKDELSVKIHGLDYETVIGLQEQWHEQAHVRDDVIGYQGKLEESFDELNLKLVLNSMNAALRSCIPPDFEDVLPIKQRVERTMNEKAYVCLDDCYYNKAMGFFHSCAGYWSRLQENPLGKFFIIFPREEKDELERTLRRSRSYFQ